MCFMIIGLVWDDNLFVIIQLFTIFGGGGLLCISVYHDQGGVQSVATGDLKIILLLPKATTLQKIISFRLNPVWLNTTSIRKKSNLIGYGMTLQTNKGKCDKQNLHYLIFQSGFPLSLFILLIWHLHDDVGKGENIQTIVWSAVSQDCHYWGP